MKLTNHQILDLSNAITALDGHTEMRLVDGKPAPVFVSYALSAVARWTLARNQGRLLAAIADFNRAKDAIIQRHSGGAGTVSPESPSFPRCAEELGALSRQETDLPLGEISLADLCLVENEKLGHGLPIGILTTLAPLIA